MYDTTKNKDNNTIQLVVYSLPLYYNTENGRIVSQHVGDQNSPSPPLCNIMRLATHFHQTLHQHTQFLSKGRTIDDPPPISTKP